jgi:lysophospholipid acyltransferase (LPLAT)-like uncharacterized protein
MARQYPLGLSPAFRVRLPLLITMISRSRDGDLATEVARRFGVIPVRGSSSRGGAPAILQFRNAVREQQAAGAPVAAIHLLDGPRGPRHASKPGVVSLARHNDALIVPVLTGAQPCRYARSWDRHAIPLPFARCSLRFGEAIDPAASDEAEAGMTPEELDRRLRELALEDPLIAPTLEQPP